MFITQEQMEKRLKSPNNVVNVINSISNSSKSIESLESIENSEFANNSEDSENLEIVKKNTTISNPTIKGKIQDNTNIVQEQLPNETNSQRAARNARNNINYEESHGEYTVNPSIQNDIMRATIASLSLNGESSQEIQKEFGVTKNQIIGARDSKKIQKRIENNRNRVSELALDKLMSTLGLLDTEEIASAKPEIQSRIASNLAKIVSSMERRENKEGNKISLTVVAPMQRNLDSYTTIDV